MVILRDVHFLVLFPQGFILGAVDQSVAIKTLRLFKIFLPAGAMGAGERLLRLVFVVQGVRGLLCLQRRRLREGPVEFDRARLFCGVFALEKRILEDL